MSCAPLVGTQKVGGDLAGAGAKARDDSSSDSDVDDAGQRIYSFLPQQEEAKTLMQLKRSRIDLLRRYVFLCPMALSKHYDTLPHQATDSALLVFRCSRDSVFQKAARSRSSSTAARIDTGARRAPPVVVGGLGSNTSQASLPVALYRSDYTKDFLSWISTKEKEGCVFWLKPECDLVQMSRFLEEKIDPLSERPYKPLLIDPQWWRVKFPRSSARYIGSPSAVIAAITRRDVAGSPSSWPQDIDIPVLQELIYQSNPTLEPISKWPHAPSMRFLPRSPRSKTLLPPEQEKSKGYITHGTPRSPEGLVDTESRIGNWPSKARDRFDNLHVLWQSEESGWERRQNFALHGQSLVSAGPCSAR